MLDSLVPERHIEVGFADWMADRCSTLFDPREAARERLALLLVNDPLLSNPPSPSTFGPAGALGTNTPFSDGEFRGFMEAFRISKHSPRIDHLERAAQDQTQPTAFRLRAIQAMSVSVALRDLTIGAEISEAPAHVSAIPYLSTAIQAYLARPSFTAAEMADPFATGGAASPTNATAGAWLVIHTGLAMRRLQKSQYFVPIGAQPNQALSVEDQNLRRLALRGHRAEVCVAWCAAQPFVAELWPALELFLQPDVQHFLRYHILDEARMDQFVAHAADVMKRPIEPLHAYSIAWARTKERMCDDQMAYPHTGLPKWMHEGAGTMSFASLDAAATEYMETDAGAPLDKDDVVAWLLDKFETAERAVSALWAKLREWSGSDADGPLPQLETSIGAVQCDAAKDYPLCAPGEEIVSVDGLATSAKVDDYMSLLMRANLPARVERHGIMFNFTGFGRGVAYVTKSFEGLTAEDDALIGEIPRPAVAVPVRSRLHAGELRRSVRRNPRIFSRSPMMRTGANLVYYPAGAEAIAAAYNIPLADATTWMNLNRAAHPEDWAHLFDVNTGQQLHGTYWCVTDITRALTYAEHQLPDYPHSDWTLFWHDGCPIAVRLQVLEVRMSRRAAHHAYPLKEIVARELEWAAQYVGDQQEGIGGRAEAQRDRQAAAGRTEHAPSGPKAS